MALKACRNTLALVLLAVSLLSLAPTLSLTAASPQTQAGKIGIQATGQATPIGKGKGKASSPALATLTLNGIVYTESNGQLKLQGLTGSLIIGSTSYTIAGGQGEGSNNGLLQINAMDSGGKHSEELVLHGSMQGSDVDFTSPQSKLASEYFLSLNGSISISLNSSPTPTPPSQQAVTVTETNTVTSIENSTQTVTQNQTVTENQTVTLPVNVTQTETTTENQTITETLTQPQNVTITVTETGTNSTVTETVTNSTTITTTIASNTTVTQNVTITVP